jgi:DNA-binding Lrp family transcriptional regulator
MVMKNTSQIPSLDQLDTQVIAELETDPRQSYKDIAAKLDVNVSAIRSRTRRLIDRGVIRPVCVVNPNAVGYKYTVLLTIHVQPGWASDVANKLAAIDRVLSVHLCIGLIDITVWAMFRTNDDLLDFISNELKPIPGLIHIETTLMLEGIKVYTRRVIVDKETFQREDETKDLVELDDLDIQLIRELQTNARQNSVQLGRKLGVYQSTVFRRMQRLLDKHIIQIILNTHPHALGYEGMATVGLKCYPGKIREAADAIASYGDVRFVSICTGRYDILAWLVFRRQSDLVNFITVELGNILGLKDTETMIIYKWIKIPWRIPV